MTLRPASLALALLVFSPWSAHSDEDADRAILDHARSIWSFQESEIRSAQIDIALLRVVAEPGQGIELGRFKTFLADSERAFADQRKPLEAIQKLGLELPMREVDRWWRPIQITVEGNNVRNTWQTVSEDRGGLDFSFSQAGDVKANRASNQFMVMKSAPMQRLSLTDLRFVPPAGLPLKVLKSQEDVAEMQIGDESEIVFDVQSGFVKQLKIGKEGQGWFEGRVQIGQASFGEIILPSVAVTYTGEGSEVTRADVFLIKQALLNEEIPDSAFVVSAPAGSMLYDYRSQAKRPDAYRLKQNVPNVIDAADGFRRKKEAEKKRTAEASKPRDSWAAQLIAANLVGLALIIIGRQLRRRT